MFKQAKNIIEYMDRQSNYTLYTPNEIFIELRDSSIKPVHIPFAYSYYFLISYLYKLCAYDEITPSQKELKEWLGFSSTNKTIDYIVKKGGVLDQLLYTQATTDYPVGCHEDEWGDIEFDTVQNEDDYMKELYRSRHSPRYSIKYPVKCFSRYPVDDLNVLDGTYYQMIDTHRTELSTIKFMVSNSELGVTAFYIYQFLLYKCDKFSEGYNGTFEQIHIETGLSVKTLTRYIKKLELHNCIVVNREWRNYVKRNTYMVNNRINFKESVDLYDDIELIKAFG